MHKNSVLQELDRETDMRVINELMEKVDDCFVKKSRFQELEQLLKCLKASKKFLGDDVLVVDGGFNERMRLGCLVRIYDLMESLADDLETWFTEIKERIQNQYTCVNYDPEVRRTYFYKLTAEDEDYAVEKNREWVNQVFGGPGNPVQVLSVMPGWDAQPLKKLTDVCVVAEGETIDEDIFC